MECIYNTGGFCWLHEEDCVYVGGEEECPEAEEG